VAVALPTATTVQQMLHWVQISAGINNVKLDMDELTQALASVAQRDALSAQLQLMEPRLAQTVEQI
jgi:hypothetical protein